MGCDGCLTMPEAWRTWAARYRTIVLEGCDGVGKTTLANRLVQHEGFEVVHSAVTPTHVNLAERYRQLLDRPGKLVLDRSFVSELVYGPLFRGGSRLTTAEAIELGRAVAAHGGVFIHLTAVPSNIAQRLPARDAHAWDEPMIGAVLVAYDQVFSALARHVPVIRYATDEP
jgi:hypothetical protein